MTDYNELIFSKDVIFSYYIKTISRKDNSSPIFIIGSGRCGSTLLSSILNCHPNIFIPKENTMTIKILKKCLFNFKLSGQARKQNVKNVLSKQYNWLKSIDKCLHKIENLQAKELSTNNYVKIIYQQAALESGKSNARWGDQTVSNSNYILSFKSQFPNSKIIYMLRDPRSVAASYFKINKTYYTIDKVIQKWELAFKKYIHLKKKYPQDIYCLSYNNLVQECNNRINYLMNWLAEDFSLLDLAKRISYSSQLIEPGSKHHHNLIKTINTNSISKWQQQLSSNEIKHIEHKLLNKYESIKHNNDK